MTINAIFACDANFGIGKNNDLPWDRHDGDMLWFRNNTKGHVVVMGRKTWESIGSKSLPNRTNVVVTSQDLMSDEGAKPHATWNGDIDLCISHLKKTYPELKIWIIGGADIYKQAFPYCDHIYMTKFHAEYDCDTFIDTNKFSSFIEMTRKSESDADYIIMRRK